MNEEGNNSLNNLNNTNLEPVGTPTPVVGPTLSENPTPVIETPVEPTPTIGDKPMNDAPKKNKTWIIIVVLLVLLVGGGILLTQSGIFDKKEEDKTEEKKEKKEETKPEDKKDEKADEDFSKYNGVYKSNNNVIKLFYYDTNLYYVINDNEDSGYFINESNGWEDIFYNNKTIKLNDNSIEFTDKENNALNGTYTKTGDYTAKDLFIDHGGDLEFYNLEKYNGYYKNEKNEMFTYQIDEESVRVMLKYENGTFDVEFDIQEDGKLFTDFLDSEFEISYDEKGNATFKTVKGEDENKYDGTYTKQGKVSFDMIIPFTF